ncbi:MAG: glycosyltransferase [Bacteroidales bacterium]|nr:glycosyltransferase [Bacteroidales bacterium]
MIEYSFIIPHKNSPDLLAVCIASIPHRPGVEIIVVDDNSDPQKVDFDNFPGKDDPFVRLIFDKNGGGCAYAVNKAMDACHGKWIVRADADDFFCPDIEKAMDTYRDTDYDIIYFKATSVCLPEMLPGHRGDTNNMAVDKALGMSDFRYLFANSCPWCKFYRREFIEKHHLRLHEVKWSTEVTFCARISVLAQKYAASDLVVYCVTDSDGTMVKNNSLECRRVRFNEDCSAVSILRPKLKHFEFLHYWMFQTWLNVYKINKHEAVKLIPSAVKAGRWDFIHQAIKAKCSR